MKQKEATVEGVTRRSFLKGGAGAVLAAGCLTALGRNVTALGAAASQNTTAKVYVCPPCGLPCDKLEFDNPGTCPTCGMILAEKSVVYGGPGQQLTIERLMAAFKVPGLSVAVIDNFKIIDTRTFGVTEAGGATPVTPRTMFQAGSVSKPVAAVGALQLVEEGKLSLDEDVNRKLKSWHVPENEFTSEQKVTLRRILSHSAGLTVHFFPGYAVGEPTPTLTQILDGQPPANSAPVRVDFVPGTRWRYSGGAQLIEQQMMIDATGEPFPRIMRERVFDKLGMKDSTFEQPLPSSRAHSAARGTYANGTAVTGGWHIYPEMAAAGLWTTPTDLAKLAIEVALAKQGRSNRLLKEATAREMLKVQMPRVEEVALGNENHRDRMGLGFFLGDDTRPDLFGHIGDDEGFQTMLLMFADTGQGAAVMANSQYGILLGNFLLEKIARKYNWKSYVPSDRPHPHPSA
jgi:CubicO group peptidase (beta-lactamase class C family)